MAAQQVGSLYLELFLDPSRYYAQIEEAERRAREMATRVERGWKQAPLRPRVDDRELTNLNKHLEVKQRHYSQVKNYIESNPIRLKVDSAELNKIDVPAQKTVKVDVVYKASGAIPQIKDSRIKIDIQFDVKNLKGFASVVGDELESVGENIVKGIKKATNKGAVGSILKGFYEGIGNTYAETLTRGAIKGLEGKFGVSIKNLGKKSSETVLGGGESLLKKMGISNLKQQVNSANQIFEELFPTDAVENKFNRIEKRVNKFFDSLTKLKSAQENLSNLGAIGQEINSIGQMPFDSLKAARKKRIDEVAQQIKQEQKQNPIKLDIPKEAERVVFATGGFAGAAGKSSDWVASKLGMLLGKKSAVIPVANPYSDTKSSVGDVGALRWSTEAAFKTVKTPIKQKVNPDAVAMARQAYAAYQQDPTKPIRLAGYSYGGQTANDALEILKSLGVQNVRAVGIGSPTFGKLSNTSRKDFQAILGKGDGVKRLQDIGALFAGQGKNLNVTPVQGHELSSYLADPKSQEIILKQIEGDKAHVRKELQDPNVFRLVDYKKNIEQMLQGVEVLLTSPVADPSLQKNLMGANLQGIQETRQELDQILGTLSKEVTQTFDDHYQALIEAENVLRDLLGHSSPAATINTSVAQTAKKTNDSAKQILTMQNKRAILEPLGTEFGIKGARKLSKEDLINQLSQKVPADILKQKLPYTVEPGQEVLQSIAKRQSLDAQSLKVVTEQSLKSIKSRSSESLRGSQLVSLSSDIEREYQIVLGLLSKNLSEDSKKVLENAKMLLGKARASAIRNVVSEVGERNQPKQQVDQSIRQGLARVSNKDVFEPIKRLKETSQQQLKENYLQVAKSLSTAQNVKFEIQKLPELVIDEAALRNMGADAFYDTNKNQILITKQIEQALKSKPKQLAKQSEILKILAHELRHAYQSDFGNISLSELTKGKTAIPLISRTQAPKSAVDAARYNVKMISRDNPQMGIAHRLGIERLEIDAYAAEKYARFAASGLNSSGKVIRQSRVEAIEEIFSNIASSIEEFLNRIDQLAPSIRANFEKLTNDAATGFSKLSVQIKNFIHTQTNPLPKTILGREGLARVNSLKRPDEAFAFTGDAAKYIKVLEYNARTMPQGSQETSRQRFVNRVIPRNFRRSATQGEQLLQEGFNVASGSIPDIMNNPVINRVLEYKLKFEIKGWSDVLEMLYKDVDKLFNGIENKAGESKYFGEFLKNAIGGLKNLNLTAIAAGVSFFRFFSMLKYTGYLVALGTAVLATATAFEALNRRFVLTAQSSVKAQGSLSQLMQAAKDLRLSRDVLLTGGSDIQASLRSRISDQTQIDKILRASATSARIYGTNPQDTQQILSGFANLAAEPTLSQSSFQQLQSSIPDIYAVGARSAGVSEQGFMQGLQRGEYTTESFLPILSQQLSAENATKTASAIDIMSAATQRMTNATEELQLAFSDFAIPFSKFTTNTFAQAIELAVKGAQLFANALTGLAFWSIYKFGKALTVLGGNVLNIASKIPFLSTAMLAMARVAQQVAANILPILGKMAKEFILFQLVVDAFTIVSIAMKDSSGEIGAAADNITGNLSKFQQELKKTREDAKLFAQELPKAFDEVKGKSYLEDTFFGGLLGKDASRAIEEYANRSNEVIRGLATPEEKERTKGTTRLTSRTEKEVNDRGIKINQITKASSEINTAIQSQLKDNSELKQLAGLDKQLASIQNRRRAMAVVDPSNRQGFNELKRQEEELLKLRQRVSAPVETLSGASTSVVKGLQEALTEYERLASERLITQDEYTKRTTEIKQALEAAEKSQEEFNKQMRNAITPLQAFERAWIKITGSLESSKNAITLTANVAKQRLAQQEIQGLATPGISSQTTSALDLQILEKQAKATREAISQMYAEIEARDGREIFKTLGVTGQTSGGEIKALAERSEGFPMQKALLERLAETRDLELNLSELDTQIAQARATAKKTLIDLTKQVADYYRGISRNAQQQAIEMQRLSNQIQATQQQNKLRAALLDGYDTIVSQFIDSIIESIGQFNQVGDRALEAQSQLLNNRFSLEDTLRSGVELSRNLPTVPIKLDFSSIPTDNDVTELGRQVNEAIEGSNDLADSINGATFNADELYKRLAENITPIEDANKHLGDTSNDFDNVNQKAQQFGSELNNIPSQIATIDQGFLGVVASLGTVIVKTLEWLANLGGVKDTLSNIGGKIGQSPVAQKLGQIWNGLQNTNIPGSNGVMAPVSGQITSPFGNRNLRLEGASKFHNGIDYGVGVGTDVKAPTSGVVSRVFRSNNGGGNVVELESITQQGEKVVQSFLHLQQALVKQGQVVKQGDVIAKSGDTGIGTGAHLHWRVMINGKPFDPQRFLGMNINIPTIGTSAPNASSNNVNTSGYTVNTDSLTKKGQQYAQLAQNSRVRAFLTAIAEAEVGKNLVQQGRGYGKQIGGNYSEEEFSNPGQLTKIPASLPGRKGQNAFGRYQIHQPDFEWAKKELGIKNLSPFNQDIIGVQRLMFRGAIEPLLRGDIDTAIKKAGNEFASLAGSKFNGDGLNRTTAGGKLGTFKANYQKYLNQMPVTVAANNYTAASPAQMQRGVGKGMQIATQNAQRQQGLTIQQSEADQETRYQQATRAANQALRQYERGRRDQSDKAISNARAVTDFGASAIKNPTPKQRQLQESTQIRRQADDLIKERERDIENRQFQINQAQDALKTGSYKGSPVTAEITKQLQQGIKENQVEIPKLKKQIQEIKKIGADYEKNMSAIFAREEKLRRQTADFEIYQGEISKTQKLLEGLQQLQQINPLDPRVFEIPKIQEEIELKQAALDLDRAIAEEDNKLFNHAINHKEYDKRIEQLKQENMARQENAMSRRQQAEAEQELQKAQRNLEVKSQITTLNNEYLQNMMQLRQLGKGGRNPLDIQREINLAQMDSDFAQKEFEITNNKNRTPQERDTAIESLRQIRQSRVDVINAELARTQEDNQIAARDLFNKSNLDIVTAQTSKLRVFGQDKRARQLEKGMAIFQQQTNFQDQIRELERLSQTNEDVAKSAGLIRANYEELNRIKLDEIENQFNEFLPAIAQVKDATQGLFSDLLSGADNALGNFTQKIFDYFTQLAAQMITNDLFGSLFKGTGGQFAPQNNGILGIVGSLFGGLFYSGGYVPNYARGYNPLSDALKREQSQTGKRAYVAVLSEGERVLNLNETRKFNAMGGENILRMATGGYAGTSPVISSMGGNITNNIKVSVNRDGVSSSQDNESRLANSLKNAVISVIISEKQPGGALYGM